LARMYPGAAFAPKMKTRLGTCRPGGCRTREGTYASEVGPPEDDLADTRLVLGLEILPVLPQALVKDE